MKIHDFEQFSWAQVQDFSKNHQLFERSRCIFAIFGGFSVFECVLARCRCIFGISWMQIRDFFNFSQIFVDLAGSDYIFCGLLSRSRCVVGIFYI